MAFTRMQQQHIGDQLTRLRTGLGGGIRPPPILVPCDDSAPACEPVLPGEGWLQTPIGKHARQRQASGASPGVGVCGVEGGVGLEGEGEGAQEQQAPLSRLQKMMQQISGNGPQAVAPPSPPSMVRFGCYAHTHTHTHTHILYADSTFADSVELSKRSCMHKSRSGMQTGPRR